MATRLLRTLALARSANSPGHIVGSFTTISRRLSTESVPNGGSDSKFYSILLSLPDGKEFANPEELENWYHSFLSGGKKSGFDKDPRIIRTYTGAIPGFSAMLSSDEVKALEKYKEFLGALPSRPCFLLTTNSPNAIGLHQRGTNHGKGMNDGARGTGMLGDEEMPPPPPDWKGQCEFDAAPVREDDYLL